MVSIIVPIYNAEKTLERCIVSIINQTETDIEIILINDGSSDNSAKICDEYLAKDNRIKYISKENSGVSDTRNVGLHQASGEYIMFVDSDDFIEKSMCTSMLKMYSSRQDSDLVVCGYYIHRHNKVFSSTYADMNYMGIKSLEKDLDNLLKNSFFNVPWNKMYKRELIKEDFDPEISLGEDLVFNLNYLKEAKSIHIVSDCLYNFDVSANSSSLGLKFRDDSFEIAEFLYNELNKFCDENNIAYENKAPVRYEFAASVFYNMQNLVINSGYRKKQKIKVISNWTSSDAMKVACKDIGSASTQVKFGIKLIQKEKNRILYNYFLIKWCAIRIKNLFRKSSFQ